MSLAYFIISYLSNSKGSRRKRDTEKEEQGVATFHPDKSDKVDMIMNPEKAEQYQNSVERTKEDIRDCSQQYYHMTFRYSIPYSRVTS